VLVIFQIPIGDARAFVPAIPRLPAPHWLDPQPREFVRGFGLVRARRRGGHTAFADEAYYASARQAIRLPRLEHAELTPARFRAACAFRRVHSDGLALARVEIGLRIRANAAPQSSTALRASEFDELISSILDLPVHVHGLNTEPKSLALHLSGPALGRLFASATTKAPQVDTPGLVSALAPAVLLQYRESEVEAPPADARVIDPKLTGGVPLAFLRREHGDQPIGIWLLREEATESDAARGLRMALLRVHAEYQALRRMLAHLADGTIQYTRDTSEGERLQEYLNRATTMLPESYPGAEPGKTIANVLHAYDDPVPAEQRAFIGAALAKVRRQIAAKVDRYLQTGEHANVNAAPEARPVHVFVSYSHRDEAYVRESDRSVLTFLSGLEREGFVFWHDRQLYASELWDPRIKEEIARADVALVLVSQHLLNSKYVTESELPALLAARRTAGLAILPLLVSASDWQSYPWLKSTQFLPRKGTLIKEYRTRAKRDELYLELFQTLRKIGAEKRKAVVAGT
jgi:hypothetical protein